MTDPIFQRLFPAAEGAVDARSFLDAVDRDREHPPGRPLVVVNMVATLDGNASFEGRSAPLSGPGDRQMFHALRGSADAIMAGTGTLGAERYRPAAKPVVTLTRSGRLPTEIPLFREPEGHVIAFCATAPDLEGVRARVDIEPSGDLAAAMARLWEGYGIRRLLCEGGPGLFGAMIRAGLADELFLTLSPRLAGGSAGPPPATGDPAPELVDMRLASVLECESMLFLRYRRTA